MKEPMKWFPTSSLWLAKAQPVAWTKTLSLYGDEGETLI